MKFLDSKRQTTATNARESHKWADQSAQRHVHRVYDSTDREGALQNEMPPEYHIDDAKGNNTKFAKIKSSILRCALIPMLIILLPKAVFSMTGQELRESCKYAIEVPIKNSAEAAQCFGYIDGVVEALDVISIMKTKDSKSFSVFRDEIVCGYEHLNLTEGQTVAIVVKYLDQKPSSWQELGARIVFVSLREAGCLNQ